MRKFFQWLWGKAKRPMSATRMLRRIMKRSDYQRLNEMVVDKRTIVEVAANLIGVSEDELLGKMSAKSGIPRAHHISSMDIAALKGVGVSDLRKAGSIAITNQGMIIGYVCCDPELLKSTTLVCSGESLYLGSWLDIARALDESERDYILQRSERDRVKEEKLLNAARKVITLTMLEAEKHGAHELEIILGNDACRYGFRTNTGKQAEGTIDKRVNRVVARVLKTASSKESFVISSKDCREAFKVKCHSYSEGTRFVIQWQRKVPEFARKSLDITASERRIKCGVSEVVLPIEPRRETKVMEAPLSAPGEDTPRVRDDLVEKEQSNKILEFSRPIKADEPLEFAPVALIVDDNSVFAKVLERFLGRHEIRVVHADSCEKGLAMLSRGEVSPDLAICDVHMPGMNGFDFLASVRGSERLNGLPIIMLTSDSDIETELRLIQEGAEVFLTKTEDPRVLCAHARRIIQRRKAA